MPNKNEIIKQLEFLSDVLSNRVRTVAAGVLAFCWVFIIEDYSRPEGGFLALAAVVPPLVLALGALFADFLQYCFGWILNRRMLGQMESKKIDNMKYNEREFLYKLRMKMFEIKIGLVSISVIWLIVLLGIKLFELIGRSEA